MTPTAASAPPDSASTIRYAEHLLRGDALPS
jgi:hypothetical protein